MSNKEDNALNEQQQEQPVACVFCGSSPGTSPAHLEAARDLGKALYKHGYKLVYGGGTTGIMGEVAKTLVSLAGPDAVHGIIPKALLDLERHKTPDPKIYGKTSEVPDMHTRKDRMAKEVIRGGAGSGFVALSGGYGTLEELMEITTWNQLGIHARGVVIYNVDGYWDGLLQWVKDALAAGFVSEGNKGIMAVATDGEGVVDRLKNYELAKGRFGLNWDEK
ncbi:hypothetical protein LTR37_004181 [Vermiconidia calcicola]|uniref:Uncharacterized protein n=1 Tax=Vermiconidia calcicola TaxID=1690605 RepID=A0ACC3NP93_9PEZI|nr:hypothetical protein LTR37_004181 [Vermiconidia calcicola]